GGVDVGILRNDTSAWIAGEDVRARRDVSVAALADRDVESYTVSAGAGLAGIGAAVAVYALGGNLVQSYSYDANDDGVLDSETPTSDGSGTVTGVADGAVEDAHIRALLGGYSNDGTDANRRVTGA